MGGSAKQLKPHNNLPGMNGNSLNPLKVSPGPGIPAPMNMPGMPGGSFNPMTQLRQLPGMGGQPESGQDEAQRLMAGIPNAPAAQQMPGADKEQALIEFQLNNAMQGQQSADKRLSLGNAGGAAGAPQMPTQGLPGMMARASAQQAAAGGAPPAPAGPLPPGFGGFGGPQDLSGTAAAGDMMPTRAGGAGAFKKAAQQAMTPAQAAKMAAKLGGGTGRR